MDSIEDIKITSPDELEEGDSYRIIFSNKPLRQLLYIDKYEERVKRAANKYEDIYTYNKCITKDYPNSPYGDLTIIVYELENKLNEHMYVHFHEHLNVFFVPINFGFRKPPETETTELYIDNPNNLNRIFENHPDDINRYEVVCDIYKLTNEYVLK